MSDTDTTVKSSEEMTEDERAVAANDRIWNDAGGGEIIHEPTGHPTEMDALEDEDDEFLDAVTAGVIQKLVDAGFTVTPPQFEAQPVVEDTAVTAASEAEAAPDLSVRVDSLESRVAELEETYAEFIAGNIDDVAELPGAVMASAEGDEDEDAQPADPDEDDDDDKEDESKSEDDD